MSMMWNNNKNQAAYKKNGKIKSKESIDMSAEQDKANAQARKSQEEQKKSQAESQKHQAELQEQSANQNKAAAQSKQEAAAAQQKQAEIMPLHQLRWIAAAACLLIGLNLTLFSSKIKNVNQESIKNITEYNLINDYSLYK